MEARRCMVGALERLCRFSGVAALLCWVGISYAGPYTGVFFIGDSMTDTGSRGVFTNDTKRVWSHEFSASLGYAATPAYSYVGANPVVGTGNNFATGGAQTVDVVRGGLQVPGVTTQVSNLLTRAGGRIDPGAVYVVSIGGNDLRSQLSAVIAAGSTAAAVNSANSAMTTAATTVAAQVSALKAAGARTLLVVNLPSFAQTPETIAMGVAAQQIADQLSVGFNNTLKNALSGASVLQFDLYKFFNALKASPASYGLTNMTTAVCGVTAITACNAASNGHFFADDLHPSVQGHQLISDWIAGTLNGLSAGSGVSRLAAVIPLGRSGAEWRTIDSRMRAFQYEGKAVSRWFVAGDYAKSRSLATDGSTAATGTTSTASIGYETTFGKNALIGVVMGHEYAPFDLPSNGGRLRYKEDMISAFVSYRSTGWYANALASHGSINYHSRRNVKIGPLTTIEAASFKGHHFGARGQLGYQLTNDLLIHGPFIGADWERVSTDGFSEGDSATSISVSPQVVKQLRSRLGYELHGVTNWLGQVWRPYGIASYDYQHLRDERTVSVGMASTGSMLAINTESKRGGNFKLQIGTALLLGKSSEISVGVSTNSGTGHGRETALNLVYGAAL